MAGEELFTHHESGSHAGLAAVVAGIPTTLHPGGSRRDADRS
ncbi:hypothetical protein [Streptomyces sp. NPDC007883]